ncbi:HAD family hydrolase [Thalassococcus sp. BH17M4-6]|uniref:HAD family hydrolase n=1 Tax=Thalassococcus sp. BH17M4-6 TaxID=3413148 RepID=UPI003BD5ABA8
MRPEVVIFDIGNVLIAWQPERYYDRVIGPDRRRALFAEVDLHDMNEAVDRGADFRETVYACAEAYPHWRDEIRMWHDNWLELATPAIPRSVRLLRALRAQGVPVFALTNFGVGTFALAELAYPFLTEFDRRYISGQMQVTKPDAEIYARVEADCGIAPEALLFTDDRADNIATASGRGWQTHLFEGPDGWAQCLVSVGLLSEAGAA